MLVGLGINFIGIDPIKALIYSAVANGLVAPVILFMIVRISSSKKVMGHWRNNWFVTLIGWIVFGAMAIAGVAAIWALLS